MFCFSGIQEQIMKSTASTRPRTDRHTLISHLKYAQPFQDKYGLLFLGKHRKVLINYPVYGLWKKTTSAYPESHGKADSFGQPTAEWHELEPLQNPRLWPGPRPWSLSSPSQDSYAQALPRIQNPGMCFLDARSPTLFFLALPSPERCLS